MAVKFKQIVIGAGVITLISLACVVYAQPFDKAQERAKEHREEMMNKLIKELGLTSEQQQQIKKQRSEQREKKKTLRDKLRQKRSELRQELEKEDTDKRKIYLLVAEIEDLMGAQLEQRVEGILAMKEILTPEQFEKLREKIKEKSEERKEKIKREREKKRRKN